MGQSDLTNYLNKHCRFRFRGGKEAFGVIWESDGNLVFASKEKHERILAESEEQSDKELYAVDSDDVLLAEVIA